MFYNAIVVIKDFGYPNIIFLDNLDTYTKIYRMLFAKGYSGQGKPAAWRRS